MDEKYRVMAIRTAIVTLCELLPVGASLLIERRECGADITAEFNGEPVDERAYEAMAHVADQARAH